tara:strand:- start:295 stop:669 length:375 start_codon:yes stop_codon:yes gene_type:complete
MPFDMPRAICPEIIHGKKFRPDESGVKNIPFTLIKRGESNCDVKLNGKEYKDLHVVEFLNACAVIGWDIDHSRTVFHLLSNNGEWSMTVSKTEYRNVEKLFEYIFDNYLWDAKNSKKGGGQGFA